MSRRNRSGIVLGLALILIGAWLLAVRLTPDLETWVDTYLPWPLTIVGIGALLLLIGLLIQAPDLAVPACIVAGIGGILYWQNLTGDYTSWSYAWTLIPGFVGVGTILAGLLRGKGLRALRDGTEMIVISLFLFVFLGSFLGDLVILNNYWPVLVIALGVWMLVRALARRRRRPSP